MAMTLGHYLIRLQQRMINANMLTKNLVAKNKEKYHRTGVVITTAEVYTKYPETENYERTYNLLNSIDIKEISEEGNNGFQIYANPNKADISAKAEGQFSLYPAYVISGNFFGNKEVQFPGERPFVEKWVDIIGPMFLKDFRNEVNSSFVRVM